MPPDQTDLQLINEKAQIRARLMILSADGSMAAASAWQMLAQRLSHLCTHAYLPWSAQERALALLHQVLRISRRSNSARAHALALCSGAAGAEAVSYMASDVVATLRSFCVPVAGSLRSACAPASGTLARVELMMSTLESMALFAFARAHTHTHTHTSAPDAQLSALRANLRNAGETLADAASTVLTAGASSASLCAGGTAESRGVGVVVALRVMRGVAGPLLVDVRLLGDTLAGSRIREVAETVSTVALGDRPEHIEPREWRRVMTAYSSERLLALDAILDACTLSTTPQHPAVVLSSSAAASELSSEVAAPAGRAILSSETRARSSEVGAERERERGTSHCNTLQHADTWMMALGDGDLSTPCAWRSLALAHPAAAPKGEGTGEGGGMAKKLVRRVLAATESAVQDGHALALLQCLTRLLPDAVLSDTRGDFPQVGHGLLTDSALDIELLQQVLDSAWAVAQQFLQEGRVKGHFTGGDWPQLSRSIMVAFLRTVFHPRIWAVRAAHAPSSPLHARWHDCWQQCRDSARFMKLFTAYSCVMWRRFPASLVSYSTAVAHMMLYGLREVSHVSHASHASHASHECVRRMCLLQYAAVCCSALHELMSRTYRYQTHVQMCH